MSDKKKNTEVAEFGFNQDFAYDIDDTPNKKKNRNPEVQRPESKKYKELRNNTTVGVQVLTGVLFVVGFFLLLCLIFKSFGVVGFMGNIFGKIMLGTTGSIAFLIPLFFFRAALKFKEEYAKCQLMWKFVFAVLTVLFASILLHTFFCLLNENCVSYSGWSKEDGVPFQLFKNYKFFDGLKALFEEGYQYIGGGLLGGLLSVLLVMLVGNAGAIIVASIFLIISLMFLFGATPAAIWERVKFYIQRSSQRRAERANAPKKVKETKPDKVKQEKESPPPAAEPIVRPTHTPVVSIEGKKRMPVVSAATAAERRTVPPVQREVVKPAETFDLNDTTEISSDDVKTTEQIENEKREAERAREREIEEQKAREQEAREQEAKEQQERLSDTSSVLAGNVSDYLHGNPCGETKDDVSDDTDELPFDVTTSAESNFEEADADQFEDDLPGDTGSPKEPQPKAEPPVLRKAAPKPPRYVFPTLDLLQEPVKKSEETANAELLENSEKIEKTLESFNIHAKVVHVSRGPAVTRYEIAPEIGTKVASIMRTSEDLSLALANSVLVEGVIPGKSAIGIQVPNKVTSIVYLKELVDNPEFRSAKSRLTAALGIDLTGSKIYCDIAKMPHLLIAGATGTGKSVTMNSIIVSLLYKSRPDEVKFIFIDPKKVEFSMYEGIPHLLVPVVSEPKKAAGALNWCVTEMERRYGLLESTHKRNINEYFEYCSEHPEAEKLAQIVIVIDELADLMLTARDAVESSISRIAAKARAAGMHLIIGTQRPSVDVITGTIKSNIPSRIACAVKGQVDSRTILDTIGAEKLVGRGDMLYAPVGSRSAYRVQGAYVDEKEIDKIVSFIKEQNGEGAYDRDIADQIEREAAELNNKGNKTQGPDSGGDDSAEGSDDPIFESAVKIALEERKVSTSLLQRRLSLGYGRAAKLIDLMEDRGIVGAPNGQKPRDVLITYEEYLEKFMRSE